MTSIETAIERLKAKSIKKPRIAPPPTKEQILEAEAELGIIFPLSFIIFLNLAGSLALAYWEMYWIGDDTYNEAKVVPGDKVLNKPK